MIKFLIITFNAILFFLIGIFSKADGIGVTGLFPKNMQPGSEALIEVTVKKGGMGGFAKLQLELPEGFTATEVESKGSNFSFAPGIVKWVWPALPAEDEVVVKFNLKADNALSGTKTIGGKFSYVENNAKQVVEMAPVEITISNDVATTPETTSETAAASNTTAPNTESTPTNTETPVVTATPTETKTPETKEEPAVVTESTPTPTTPVASLNDEPPGSVTVLRYIKPGSNTDEHLIELKINKGSIRGFAKYSDALPAGYTAKSVSTSESSFSVADGKIKFVWVTLPASEEITISYLLSGRSTSMVELLGEFSYLANDQSKKFIMQNVTLPNTPSSNDVAQTTPTPTETPITPKEDPITPTETNTTVTVTTPDSTPTPTETPTNTNNTENTSDAVASNNAGSINYRVQIGAFANSAVSAQTLSRKFGVRGTIISEMHGGLNKFMVGNHPEYQNARNQREEVKSSINSAFVVAYNGSKRITVQEALMLTNQKWFK